jgi:hypothetical protein
LTTSRLAPHGETKIGELKVWPHVRDMILDHAPLKGSGAGYDHGIYRDEWPALWSVGPLISNGS